MRRSWYAGAAFFVLLGITTTGASAQTVGQDRVLQQRLINLLERARNQASPATAPTAVSRAGSFVFNITLALNSGVSSPITCEASVSHEGSNAYYDQDRGVAASISGKTGTCTIVMDYHWPSADATQQVSVEIYLNTLNCTCSSGSYYVSHELPDIPLPANGATTTIKYNVVL